MTNKWLHNDPEYLIYDQEQKDFMQRMLFMEYLEDWEVSRFHGRPHHGFENSLVMDMIDYEEAECYEICQLYRDTLERFKQDIREFDNE